MTKKRPVLFHFVPCTVTYYRIQLKRRELRLWTKWGATGRLPIARPTHSLRLSGVEARQVGLEPTTSRLTAGCSTIELLPNLEPPASPASHVYAMNYRKTNDLGLK